MNSNKTRCFCQLLKLECFKHALSNPDFVSLFGGAQASAFCAAARFALVARLSLLECGFPCS